MPRVVLDHCVPRSLLRHVTAPGATTVGAHGWAGRDDGPLLDLLAPLCDVFVTTDQNLPFQQRLDTRPFATIVLIAAGLLTLAHVWRVIKERPSLATDPSYILITVVSAALCLRAWRLLRFSRRS